MPTRTSRRDTDGSLFFTSHGRATYGVGMTSVTDWPIALASHMEVWLRRSISKYAGMPKFRVESCLPSSASPRGSMASIKRRGINPVIPTTSKITRAILPTWVSRIRLYRDVVLRELRSDNYRHYHPEGTVAPVAAC